VGFAVVLTIFWLLSLYLQVGISLVGMSSVFSGEGSSTHKVSTEEMLMGMGLIVMSQVSYWHWQSFDLTEVRVSWTRRCETGHSSDIIPVQSRHTALAAVGVEVEHAPDVLLWFAPLSDVCILEETVC
jgi:hypothetical protein